MREHSANLTHQTPIERNPGRIGVAIRRASNDEVVSAESEIPAGSHVLLPTMTSHQPVLLFSITPQQTGTIRLSLVEVGRSTVPTTLTASLPIPEMVLGSRNHITLSSSPHTLLSSSSLFL